MNNQHTVLLKSIKKASKLLKRLNYNKIKCL